MQFGVWQRPVFMTGSALQVMVPVKLSAQHPGQKAIRRNEITGTRVASCLHFEGRPSNDFNHIDSDGSMVDVCAGAKASRAHKGSQHLQRNDGYSREGRNHSSGARGEKASRDVTCRSWQFGMTPLPDAVAIKDPQSSLKPSDALRSS